MVLDLNRLLDFGFWTRFGDNVEPRTFFFLWIHLDWFLASWFFREAGFDSLGSLASRPRFGDTPSVEAFNVIIFLRSVALALRPQVCLKCKNIQRRVILYNYRKSALENMLDVYSCVGCPT